MRVLIEAASAKRGGFANYVETMAREWATHSEHEFIWYVPPERERAFSNPPAHFRVAYTRAGWFGPLRRLWWNQVTLRRIIRRERPDVLLSARNFGLWHAPMKQVLLVSQALPFSSNDGASLRARVALRLRRWLIGQSARRADLVITPTRDMLDRLLRYVPLDPTKARVIPFGVSPGVSCHGTRPSDNGDSIAQSQTLLFVSLYGDHKNLGTLLRALPLLNAHRHHRYRLLSTANPYWKEAETTRNYARDRALATRSDIEPWVRFVGPCAAEQTAALYAESDIFVFPSLAESFGFPLAEAMSYGLPIVAADTRVNRELCGDAALYFAPLDPASLAEQVRRLAENRLRDELGRRALERAKLYGARRHADELLAALGEVARNGLTGRRACALCGESIAPRRKLLALGVTYFECPRCGLVFQNLGGLSPGEVVNRLQERELASVARGAERRTPLVARENVAHLRRLARWVRPPGWLLDVGCGRGDFLLSAQQAGWEAYGVEADARQAAQAATRVGAACIHPGVLGTAPFPRQAFRAITLKHVLEHIPDLRAFVRTLKTFLTPDGVLFIELPNFASLSRRLYGERWLPLFPSEHVWQFTPRTLVALLRQEGFACLDWESDESYEDSVYMLAYWLLQWWKRGAAEPERVKPVVELADHRPSEEAKDRFFRLVARSRPVLGPLHWLTTRPLRWLSLGCVLRGYFRLR